MIFQNTPTNVYVPRIPAKSVQDQVLSLRSAAHVWARDFIRFGNLETASTVTKTLDYLNRFANHAKVDSAKPDAKAVNQHIILNIRRY